MKPTGVKKPARLKLPPEPTYSIDDDDAATNYNKREAWRAECRALEVEYKESMDRYTAVTEMAQREATKALEVARDFNIKLIDPDPVIYGKVLHARHDGSLWLRRETGDWLCSYFHVLGSVTLLDQPKTPRLVRAQVLSSAGALVDVDLTSDEIVKSYGRSAISKMHAAGLRYAPGGDAFVGDILAGAKLGGPKIAERAGWRLVGDQRAYLCPYGRMLLGPETLKLELGGPLKLDGEPTNGDRAAWIEAVAHVFKPFREESEAEDGGEDKPERYACAHQAAIGLGLAGPIPDLIGAAPVVIMWEGPSTWGKSSLQELQVSTTGETELGAGLFQSLNGTENSVEGLLAKFYGSTGALDDTKHLAASSLEKIGFNLQARRSKGRLKVDGSDRARNKLGGTISLSGEVGAAQRFQAEKITAAGGFGVRMLGVPVETANRLPAEVYGEVKPALTNYGHAAPVFMDALKAAGYIANPAALDSRISARVLVIIARGLLESEKPGAIWANLPTEEQAPYVKRADEKDYVKRGLRMVATISTALEIARDYPACPLIPAAWKADEMERWLAGLFKDSALSTEDPDGAAVAKLCEALAARRGIDVMDTTSQHPRCSQETNAWKVERKGYGEVYVVRASALAGFMGSGGGGGVTVGRLKKRLEKDGYLIRYQRKPEPTPTWDSWPDPVSVMASLLVLRANRVEGLEAEPAANDTAPKPEQDKRDQNSRTG